jgi:hypothetical protein
MGLIGFLQGDGRFGVLEILKHVAPGFVIDIGEPFRKPSQCGSKANFRD